MTDEEIEKEAKKNSQGNYYYEQGFLYGYELGLTEGRKEVREHETTCINRLHHIEKENAELKKEISVLLSCSNCPENKGGYVCEKEYNDKCLAQKIEHIKELNEENAELKERLELFNAVGNTVDKQTYNAVVNENELLKKEIEKLRKHNLNVQKICFDSCL